MCHLSVVQFKTRLNVTAEVKAWWQFQIVEYHKVV